MMVLEIEQQLEKILKTIDILYWLENPRSESLVAICGIPVDLEHQLYQVLWRNGIPKIVTSGTLSDDMGFDYFKRNTGINLIASSSTSEISYLSPFDYNKNALLYISEKVPFPDNVKNTLKLLQMKSQTLLMQHGDTLLFYLHHIHCYLRFMSWPGVKLNTLF